MQLISEEFHFSVNHHEVSVGVFFLSFLQRVTITVLPTLNLTISPSFSLHLSNDELEKLDIE